MCRRCFKSKLACYTPATDEDIWQDDREDYREFRQGYEDWLDDYTDYAYETSREEEYND